MDLAPIVLFAFNRPAQLGACLEALVRNPEAARSPLFIFVDGPRCPEEQDKVDETLRRAYAASGFASVEVRASARNQGLGPSIIAGVSRVMDRFGQAIVLEDDLVVSRNFLCYMNQGLRRFADEKDVFSICGYSLDLGRPGTAADCYFANRSSSWGWASWKDRWDSVSWDPSAEEIRRYRRAFNRWGGSDCAGMLMDWRRGRNKSWAIRFCFSQFLQGKVSLFPVQSLVNPDAGFTGDGTNCKRYSRFRHLLQEGDERHFQYPEQIAADPEAQRRVMRYHSIPARLYSRIMYLIYR